MLDKLVDCSFCGRNQLDTLCMIAGTDVYICRECIVESVNFLTSRSPKQSSKSSVRRTYFATDLMLRCAFCKRRAIDVRAVATINDSKHYICDECVMVCFDITLREIFGKRRPSDDSIYFLIHK
jgi:ATP-dependent protease Clp ATPase subunit